MSGDDSETVHYNNEEYWVTYKYNLMTWDSKPGFSGKRTENGEEAIRSREDMYPPSKLIRKRTMGEEIAIMGEGCQEKRILRGKPSFWAKRRKEYSEKRLEIRFCWWCTINSRGHSRRVQKLWKGGKRGQDEEVWNVFLKSSGRSTKESDGIVDTDLQNRRRRKPSVTLAKKVGKNL